MDIRHTTCTNCGTTILVRTAVKTGGVCMPCSRKKGIFERDKYDGYWRLQDEASAPFPYALEGTETSYDSQALCLAETILAAHLRYIEWGVTYLLQYIKPLKWHATGIWEVMEVRFPAGGENFSVIYELPGDDSAFWIVEFRKGEGSHGEPCWPIRFSREER